MLLLYIVHYMLNFYKVENYLSKPQSTKKIHHGRKRRKTFRKKSRKTFRKKMRGGVGGVYVNIKMTIGDIMDTIMNTRSEYCGYIKDGDFICNHIGDPKPEEGVAKEIHRGTCEQQIKTQIWHTHSSISKYYPSFEDINKVFKYEIIKKSYIITQFGYWRLEYNPDEKRVLDEREIKELQRCSRDFYINTEKGRKYNKVSIDKFVFDVNRILNLDFISWTDLS